MVLMNPSTQQQIKRTKAKSFVKKKMDKEKVFSISSGRILVLLLTIFRGWIGACKQKCLVVVLFVFFLFFSCFFFFFFFFFFYRSAFVGMPYGVVAAGYLWSAVSIALLGWLSAYCANLVLICKYKRVGPNASFADLAEHVMGHRGVILLDFLVVFCQIGFCMSYIIFIERNVQSLLPNVNMPFASLALQCLLVFLVIVTSGPNVLSGIATISSLLVFGGLCLCLPYFSWKLSSEVSAIHPAGIPLLLGMACSAMTVESLNACVLFVVFFLKKKNNRGSGLCFLLNLHCRRKKRRRKRKNFPVSSNML